MAGGGERKDNNDDAAAASSNDKSSGAMPTKPTESLTNPQQKLYAVLQHQTLRELKEQEYQAILSEYSSTNFCSTDIQFVYYRVLNKCDIYLLVPKNKLNDLVQSGSRDSYNRKLSLRSLTLRKSCSNYATDPLAFYRTVTSITLDPQLPIRSTQLTSDDIKSLHAAIFTWIKELNKTRPECKKGKRKLHQAKLKSARRPNSKRRKRKTHQSSATQHKKNQPDYKDPLLAELVDKSYLSDKGIEKLLEETEGPANPEPVSHQKFFPDSRTKIGPDVAGNQQTADATAKPS